MQAVSRPVALSSPGPPVPRALGLDALRGLAILMMCLSGIVPHYLPSAMYHGYYPQYLPDEAGVWRAVSDPHAFNRGAAFTWVDWVFPMFLFAMGVAFPFALRGRMDRGASGWWLGVRVVGRGVLLMLFAVYLQYIAPGFIRSTGRVGGAASLLLAFLGFLALFAVFMRLPSGWSAGSRRWVRLGGALACVSIVWLVCALRGVGFSWEQKDIIILLLAWSAIVGSLAWLVTSWLPAGWRGAARLVLFMPLVFVAHHQAMAGSWRWFGDAFDPWMPYLQAPKRWLDLGHWLAMAELPGVTPERLAAWSGLLDLGWLYDFKWFKFLWIVIPATLLGDRLLRYQAERLAVGGAADERGQGEEQEQGQGEGEGQGQVGGGRAERDGERVDGGVDGLGEAATSGAVAGAGARVDEAGVYDLAEPESSDSGVSDPGVMGAAALVTPTAEGLGSAGDGVAGGGAGSDASRSASGLALLAASGLLLVSIVVAHVALIQPRTVLLEGAGPGAGTGSEGAEAAVGVWAYAVTWPLLFALAALLPAGLALVCVRGAGPGPLSRLTRDVIWFGLVWLALGLLVEPWEGGIKKGPPATMSYYMVTLGLSSFALAALTALCDRFAFWRGLLTPVIANGRNPMVAYVAIRSVLAPLCALPLLAWLMPDTPSLDRFFEAVVFPVSAISAGDAWDWLTMPWGQLGWALMKTALLGMIVWAMTESRLIWRS